MGPTGVGKSELAVSLAKKINGEIINSDAFQCYEELRICTAAPSERMKKEVPHHLYSFVPLASSFSIHEYQPLAREALKDVISRGKTPIFVGGSGLYLRSALYDYDLNLDTSKVDMTPYEAMSDEELHKELEKLDPEEANKIDKNNRRRVYRDLEIILASGESKTSLLAKQSHEPVYPTLFFGLEKERSSLYQSVDARVEKMFSLGLVEEVVPLIKKYGRSPSAFKAIGVKEFFPYLDGISTLEETKALIKLNTRHYVKRQDTFFAHQFPTICVQSEDEILGRLAHE